MEIESQGGNDARDPDARPESLTATFRTTRGEERGAFPEWEAGVVDLGPSPDDWGAATVTINGAEHAKPSLRRYGHENHLTFDWPRAGTGHYKIVLGAADGTARSCQRTVEPRKISQYAFDSMLEDLDHWLPAAITIAIQRLGGLAGIAFLDPEESTHAQELDRLRRAVDGHAGQIGLLRILERLAPGPHRILRVEEVWVHPFRARRPPPERLSRALARGRFLGADDGPGALATADRALADIPDRVIDRRVEPTCDVYENRLVRAFVDLMLLRLRRLERETGGLRTSSTATAGSATIEEQARDLRRRFERQRRAAPFLDEVERLTRTPDRLTMVLLRNPLYRAALRGYRELFRSHTVRFDRPHPESPLEELPKLYEIWGTLRVHRALLAWAEHAGFRVEAEELIERSREGEFVLILPDGKPSLRLRRDADECTITLTPQRRFRSVVSSGGYRSVTSSQIPDATVEITQPDEPPRLLLFDPKYRLESEYRGSDTPPESDVDEAVSTSSAGNITPASAAGSPKKGDIDRMHAYRDAIRDAADRRPVVHAAILYPGPTVRYPNAGISALRAVPGEDGCSLAKEIADILDRALASAAPQPVED